MKNYFGSSRAWVLLATAIIGSVVHLYSIVGAEILWNFMPISSSKAYTIQDTRTFLAISLTLYFVGCAFLDNKKEGR